MYNKKNKVFHNDIVLYFKIKENTQDYLIVYTNKDVWFYNTNEFEDIAILNFTKLVGNLNNNIQIDIEPIYYDENVFNSDENLPLEKVLFIGYPNGIFDKYSLSPIIRQGITSTPITIDYDNQSQFLIDASVFDGSSGSPVFKLQDDINGACLAKDETIKDQLYFLGILTESSYEDSQIDDLLNKMGQFEDQVKSSPRGEKRTSNEDKIKKILKYLLKNPGYYLNIGYVLKSHLIINIISQMKNYKPSYENTSSKVEKYPVK